MGGLHPQWWVSAGEGWGRFLLAAKLIPGKQRRWGGHSLPRAPAGPRAWSLQPGCLRGPRPDAAHPSPPPLCLGFVLGTLEIPSAAAQGHLPFRTQKPFRCVVLAHPQLLTRLLGSFRGDR